MSELFYIKFSEERYFVYEVPTELHHLPYEEIFERMQGYIHGSDYIAEEKYPELLPFHDVDLRVFFNALEKKLKKYGRKVYDGDSEGWNDEIRVRE
jgi:hypothetical protein